jgi:hypothetical protein
MKYRKKPVEVEAVQYDRTKTIPIDGLCYSAHDGIQGAPHIHTLEGIMEVSHGDWIITGVKGEKYPCKPDIFEMTYEKVTP